MQLVLQVVPSRDSAVSLFIRCIPALQVAVAGCGLQHCELWAVGCRLVVLVALCRNQGTGRCFSFGVTYMWTCALDYNKRCI